MLLITYVPATDPDLYGFFPEYAEAREQLPIAQEYMDGLPEYVIDVRVAANSWEELWDQVTIAPDEELREEGYLD